MKKYLFAQSKIFGGIYTGFIFLLLLTIKANGQSTLPPGINKIFFETSEFNRPIWLELPSESSLSQFQNISQTPDIYESGMPKATIIIGEDKGVEDYDKYLLSFLVKNGYAKIETKIQITHGSYGTTSKKYNFIFYSENFKKNIQYANVKDVYGESKTKPFIKLAHRKIISIDYKKEYEDAPLGMKRTFYSVVFSYSFVNDLSNLPSISKVFKGKGKAFKDPDDGTWKMKGPFENLGIKLDDNSSNEFLNLFRNNYEPFSFEIRAAEKRMNTFKSVKIDDKSVKINEQIWMTENLNVDRFRNGDPIPEAKTSEEWTKAGEEGKPAWCYYDNNPENGKKYGKLYNWYAVNDKRGLAPKGWHIPTKAEFETLNTTVDNNYNTLKAINQGSESRAGTNSSGFSVLPAGYRQCSSSTFGNLGEVTGLWSSTEDDSASAQYLGMSDDLSTIGFYGTFKGTGLSVRCVKD